MILVDLHGGDNSPAVPLTAVTKFAASNPQIPIKLFGTEDSGLHLAKRYEHVEYVDCASVIGMCASVPSALREGSSSTMWQAMNFINSHEGKDAVVISAGNTGAMIALAKQVIGMRYGALKRPALLSRMPGTKVHCADLGANLELSSQQLHVLAQCSLQVLGHLADPKVAILNIGKEATKGTQTTKEAYELLQADPAINFTGFIEPHDVLQSDNDLVIMDGLMGNIMLKSFEGAFEYSVSGLIGELKKQLLGKLALWLNTGVRSYVSEHADKQYALLVGLNAPVIKLHGRSDLRAFSQGLNAARQLIENTTHAPL